MGLIIDFWNYVLGAVILAVLILTFSRPRTRITRNGEPLR